MIMAIIKSTLGGVVEDHNMDYEQFGSKCLYWNRFRQGGRQAGGRQAGRQKDSRQTDSRRAARQTDR
jgi:hypothetical protein